MNQLQKIMRAEKNKASEKAIRGAEDPEFLHRRLNECHDKLRDGNDKIGEYVQINSHQIRGPIARVQGLVNLLYNSHCKIDLEEILGYIKISAEELDKMTREISDRLCESSELEDCRECA